MKTRLKQRQGAYRLDMIYGVGFGGSTWGSLNRMVVKLQCKPRNQQCSTCSKDVKTWGGWRWNILMSDVCQGFLEGELKMVQFACPPSRPDGMIEWMNEWLNEWMNEWMKEWSNEWMTNRTQDWVFVCYIIRMNEWMKEWMNAWMNDQPNIRLGFCLLYHRMIDYLFIRTA